MLVLHTVHHCVPSSEVFTSIKICDVSISMIRPIEYIKTHLLVSATDSPVNIGLPLTPVFSPVVARANVPLVLGLRVVVALVAGIHGVLPHSHAFFNVGPDLAKADGAD